ncbi:MAG: hypothetical protein CMH57_07190 [Myxococcales bacterium]|nr:hypothetical protein [Myxococcales bacterium]
MTNTNANVAQPPQYAMVHQPIQVKSAGLAAVLSLVFVGAGQVYNGQVLKGVLMFFVCIFLWGIALGWIINLWSIFDAHSTANKINRANGVY